MTDQLTPAEAAEAQRVMDEPAIEAASRLRHEVAIHVAEYGRDVSVPGFDRDILTVAEAVPALVARVRVLEQALDIAGRDFVAGHIHLAERLNESNYKWLMHHLEAAFGRVCAALRATTPDAKGG